LARPAVVPPKTLAPYFDEYRASTETAWVTLEDGKLYSATTNGRRELRATPDTQFYCADVDIEFTFKKGKRGRVSTVTVQQPMHAYDRVRVK
jgi:hypothetical protein